MRYFHLYRSNPPLLASLKKYKGAIMNANPKFLSATATVDEAAVQPLPNSSKVYVQGSRPDIRVPMRRISQSDTAASFGFEANPPIYVYDTSGPYSDPDAKIDIRSGLSSVRGPWIAERDDTEELSGPSSAYGVERLNDPEQIKLEPDPLTPPLSQRERVRTGHDEIKTPSCRINIYANSHVKSWN
jgi:hypothetical protein